MRLILVLTLVSFNSFGQKTFEIDKTETDSTDLNDYKIFSVSEDVDINFIGEQIPKSKRFKLTREEAITADQLFKEQYVKASVDQYHKQFINPDQYSEGSAEFEKAKQTYERTYKTIESKAKRDSRKRISKFDRYFFGYTNADNEKLVLMRFDPHKIKYYSLPGTGESHIDVLTIYVLNLNKKDLSMSGWADFKED
jgi:hypothetical protein